jgi:nicotinate phosphoribosyltransferase
MNNRNLYTPRDIFAAARDEAEVSNLLNTDMYKFMMMDFILAHPEYKDVNVRRDLKIRSKNVRTADVIPERALREQLEATKAIQWVSEADLSFLRWMNQPNGKPLFRDETLEFLKNFRFCGYDIGVDETGNYTLSFTGPRQTSMMREIAGLKIINSLYLYHYTKKAKLSDSEFNYIINKSIWRLYDDIAIFKSEQDFRFMEFGTRRSMSTDYHRLVFDILSDSLPQQLSWTSNVLLSKERGSTNPKGTNAHELRMIPTALVDDPQEIIDTMYNIDRQWIKHYPGLGVLLPDTFGSSFYFNNCPEDIALLHDRWDRIDSKNPFIAIPEYINFLKKRDRNPKELTAYPSDWLTARTSIDIYNTFKDQINIQTGNGTHVSNNTVGTWPRAEEPFGQFWAFSVVIKPASVINKYGIEVPCVKTSDNPEKTTEGYVPEYKTVTWQTRGDFFRDIFRNEWVVSQKVLV